LVGGLVALQGLSLELVAQESKTAERLDNIPISRLPSSRRSDTAVRKATFDEEFAETEELNWRRRDITQTSAPTLRTPQTGVRVATKQDPLSDPFGDRPITPAPAASYTPSPLPQLQPAFGNAGFSARRNPQASDDLESRAVTCDVLTETNITTITFSMAPPLLPGRPSEMRQDYVKNLSKLIGNPVVTWTTVKDGALVSYEGRFVSANGADRIDTVEIKTKDNEVIKLGTVENGFLTAESEKMAEISVLNPLQDWVDRTGHVVATGWFLDFVNGSVIIRTESGEDVTARYNDLGPASVATVNSIWNLPSECPVPAVGSTQRDWVAQTYTWKASALCHKPLYFEDIQLERYGHSAGPLVQPFRSGAHFFLNIAALPYNVGVYPPTECRYALGYYRPGNCAPFRGYALPLSKRGALTATGFYIAAPVILP
jgi:hypothetical protein